MVRPPNTNRPANRRGFGPQGKPTGWGQQRGHSPWLDREQQDDPMELDLENLQPGGLASAPGFAQPQAPYQHELDTEPAYLSALRGQISQAAPDMFATAAGAPTSNTMPIGEPRRVQPQGPANSSGDFLQHAGRFSPNPSGLNSLMADEQFRARFPNARIHKNDWVDPGDGSGLIDTVRGFNPDTDGGEAWQWLTEADAINGAQANNDSQHRIQAARAAQQTMTPLGSEDDLDAILDYLLEQELL